MLEYVGPKSPPSSVPSASRPPPGSGIAASKSFDPFENLPDNSAASKSPRNAGGISSSSSRPIVRATSIDGLSKGPVSTADLASHITQQQEDALRLLRDNDAKSAAEADAKRAATHVLEDKLNAWSLKDGQKRGIRALLSSLHTILWSNSGWKPVGLADLIDLNAIKKVNRKAMLLVHPDKLQDASPEQHVIAEHAFTALNEAFDRFVETGQ